MKPKTKIITVYKKKTLFCDFLDFLGKKCIRDYVINTKNKKSNFASTIFFRKGYLRLKASLQPKKGLKLLALFQFSPFKFNFEKSI